ncbi:DMT family transporter [Francisella tularensis subsp. novicida]|uniref:DMT family transporter n=1 Tax=Francisella tularensis TaxID=263 RepID=UPI00031E0A71|nr:DMT family transporter [Francisella tularensis]AJI46162.1 eamA-like transporter family protein [Francisella tularensis subsp. novicida F6168]AJJ47474.1 eamA-like transporter family protein [Francisella tularensis subsp. novicida]APC98596.1 eamA-like transporter family protein [Francisella tularensis subsp. novicida]KFJ66779.1 eamA-like transporter family protein [Francisella tularensis subsp. novicida]MBK2109164.1 DMT family transporter [Francisella tularensis subsp. novicida FSC595]
MHNLLSTKKALILLLLTITMWSTAFIGIRYLMLNGFSAGGLSLTRYAIASMVMLIIFIRQKNKTPPSLKDLFMFAILGFFGFFAYNVFLNSGESRITAAGANFIISQAPIIVAILAFVFWGEKINKYGIFGFVIAIIGATIIFFSKNDTSFEFIGICLVYGACFSGAIYSVFQKSLFIKFHPIEAITYCIWFGTIMLLIYSNQAYTELATADLSSILVVVYIGIFPGALGYLFWGYAFRHLSATIAISFLYFMPIISLFLGWIFLGETEAYSAIVGGIISVIGAFIISKYGLNKKTN